MGGVSEASGVGPFNIRLYVRIYVRVYVPQGVRVGSGTWASREVK